MTFMKFPYNFLVIAILLITASRTVIAQSQSEEGPPDANRTGAISGQVVSDAGQPLANASVAVRPYGGRPRTTSTDNEGNFQMSGLERVAYLVSASLPAYVSAPRDPDVYPNGYYRVGDSVRLELVKGGVITGTVTRAVGEPVVGVTVRAVMIRDGNGQPSRYGSSFREQHTDDRGVYRIYGLALGTYLVSAGGADNSDGYSVNAYGTDAPTYAPSATRDNAAEFFVRPGEESANVDIRYRGEPGHVVSGIASSSVVLDQRSGFNITLTSIVSGASQSTQPAYQPVDGRGFVFYGVGDGDYDVTAESYLPGGDWLSSAPRRIKVKGADVTGIDLIAKPLGSISGRVVLEESNAPECKGKRRPLFGETLVTPWHNEKSAPLSQPQYLWSLGAPTFPDQQGEFALRSLAPGQYRLSARSMAKYWYLKSISGPAAVLGAAKGAPANGQVDAARNWMTLKSGDRLSGLTITLAEGAASLHGLIDGEGQKLPGRLFAYLVPAELEKADDVLRFFATMVLSDGSFVMNNLPPGRYWLIARAADEKETNVLTRLRLPDEAEARARLRHAAEGAKIETELEPCQNVIDYRLPLPRP